MVINDKLANQQDINKVYSVKDAYNYILTADTAHYRPDILRQCSLNEYLFPNLTYDEQRTETAKKEMLDNYSPTKPSNAWITFSFPRSQTYNKS